MVYLPAPQLSFQRSMLLDLRVWVRFGLALLTFLLLMNTFAPRYVVRGQSMEPSIHNNERLLISPIPYLFDQPQRGDVIVFMRRPDDALIKRIVGLPGETVYLRDGIVYVNDQAISEPYINMPCRVCADRSWTLGPDEFFVLGDNRNVSVDSHVFGPINRQQIVGQVLLRWWPQFEIMH